MSSNMMKSKEMTQKPMGVKEMTQEPMGVKEMTQEPMGAKEMTQEPMGAKEMTQEPMGAKEMTQERMGSKQMSGGIKETEAKSTRPSGALPLRTEVVDPDTFVKMNPDGMYLIYEERDGGTFSVKFSTEEVPRAIAFARPSPHVNVPLFKYKKPTQIQIKVTSGRQMYFQAWAQWIKEARGFEAEFVLLNELTELERDQDKNFPPMKIFLLSGSKVEEISKGDKNRPFKLRFTEAVAIVSESFSGLDDLLKESDIDLRKFSDRTKSAQEKCFMEFK